MQHLATGWNLLRLAADLLDNNKSEWPSHIRSVMTSHTNNILFLTLTSTQWSVAFRDEQQVQYASEIQTDVPAEGGDLCFGLRAATGPPTPR